MLPLLTMAASAAATTWHGPTALIWSDCQCALLDSACKGANHTVHDCEAACAKRQGCTALAFNTGPATGDRCQLRGCNASQPAPSWSVPGWRGYATFPVPVAPPAPPAPPVPPPAPQVPLILLEKQQNATGASCLDGTPPAFYFEPGVGEDAKNCEYRQSPPHLGFGGHC